MATFSSIEGVDMRVLSYLDLTPPFEGFRTWWHHDARVFTMDWEGDMSSRTESYGGQFAYQLDGDTDEVTGITGEVTSFSYESDSDDDFDDEDGEENPAWYPDHFTIEDFTLPVSMFQSPDDLALTNAIFAGSDSVDGSNFADVLFGFAGDDLVYGNGGNDTLDGGTGADRMLGGSGNDRYFVDSAGDAIVEFTGKGTDTVESQISYTLGAAVENLKLLGADAVSATGNRLDNELTGTAAANVLDGGAGVDRLAGGEGDDTYYVDNVSDVVVGELKAAAGGVDKVFSSVSWSLKLSYTEQLALTGTANLDAMGNSLANVLTGNDGSNVLDGYIGADTLKGGGGNDTYYIDNLGDDIVGERSDGTTGDRAFTSVTYSIQSDYVEKLTLTGTANINGTGNKLNNALTGNDGNNTLAGAAGNDLLRGGLGADQLSGGVGNDRFIFATAAESTLSALDRITDFARGTDKLDLSRLDGDAVLSGHQDFTFIGSSAFGGDATGQLRFAYNASGGHVALYGSTDADAAAEFVVHLTGLTALSSGDFLF
ncbi:MAG TPA: calcium-binding protein [Ramlibacter sp.]